MKKLGYGSVFVAAWMYDGKIPVGKTLDRLGYSRICVSHDLWYDDEDYTCVVCGGRCRCGAVIYVKDLSDREE